MANGYDFLPNIFSVKKTVDKTFASISDKLIYTLYVHNGTPLPIPNIKVYDILPSELTFVPGSVLVNDVTIPSASILPPNGIQFPTIAANSTLKVQFKATVNSIPPGVITNVGTALFRVLPFPAVPAESNPVSTLIGPFGLETLVFTTPKSSVILSESIPFILKIRNNGAFPLENVVVNITVPDGFLFDEDSVYINEHPCGCIDPPNLVQIPLLNPIVPGQTVLIGFNIIVVDPPLGVYDFTPFITANYREFFYFTNTPSLLITVGTNKYIYKQYVDRLCARKCDLLTYTLVISNDATSAASGEATIFNLVPCNSRLLNNCFIINNTPLPVPNPCLSLKTPNIPVGGAVTITYSVIAGCHGNCIINEPIAYVSGTEGTMTPILPNKAVTILC